MDRAYAGEVTRQLARNLGYWPVAPPRRHRKVMGSYDTALYRQRNAVARLFGRLKQRFRRIFTRYDQLDPRYLGFVLPACVYELLRCLF